MSCRQFVTETKLFYQASQTDSNCNGILFVNTGTTTVTIDGFLLQPSQSWSIDGNRDEMLVKTYTFNFGAGAGSQLTIIFKRYVGA
jgi:hypothetical protein